MFQQLISRLDASDEVTGAIIMPVEDGRDGVVSSRDKDEQLCDKRKELCKPEPVRKFKSTQIFIPKRTLLFLNGEGGKPRSHSSALVRRWEKSNSVSQQEIAGVRSEWAWENRMEHNSYVIKNIEYGWHVNMHLSLIHI